jgi:hypothetical protein
MTRNCVDHHDGARAESITGRAVVCRASAPQVKRLNKAFIDVLHLLVRCPCESLIDVCASVFIGIDLSLPVMSVRT